MRSRALLLLAVSSAVTACGGSKHPAATAASPLDAVRSAFHKTIGAGSESLSLKASGQTAGQAVVLAGRGEFDTRHERGRLSLHLDAGPLASSFDEVLLGTAVYVRSPLLAGRLPAGKSWIKVDLAKLGGVGGLPKSLLAPNPAAELNALRYLRSATRVGTGRTGTQYHAVLESTKLPRAFRAISGYDVWVGDDGYVHRVQIASAPSKLSLTVDLSGFGEKVDAIAPPAAQVFATTNLPGLGG
jgi:hypothetical protein